MLRAPESNGERRGELAPAVPRSGEESTIHRRASPSFLLALALLDGGRCGGTPRGRHEAAPSPAPPPPKAVIVVTMEGWWAPGDPEDPFGVDFLPGSVRFEDVTTPCPQPRPAVASILTGQAPDRLGVQDNANTPLPSGVPTLPSLLAERGFEAAAFVANPLLGFGSGLERGFGLVDAPNDFVAGPFRRLPPVRSPEEIGENLISWIGSLSPDSRLFAWAHLCGFEPPQRRTPREKAPEPRTSPARVREAVAKIAARLPEVAKGREVVLLVAGAAGRLDPDRGEASGYFLAPEVLDVPFFRLPIPPRQEPEFARAGPLWLPDVAALVAKEAGLDRAFPDGSWPPSPERNGSRPRRAWTWLGAREFGWPAEWAVIGPDLLLVKQSGTTPPVAISRRDGKPAGVSPPAELLRALEERPGPEEDLFRAMPALPDSLREAVAGAGIEIPAPPPPKPPAPRRDRMAAIPLIEKARRLALEGAPRQAKRAYDEVLKVDAGNAGASLEAGEILALSGMARLARPPLEAAVAARPGWADAWHWLGHLAFIEKNIEKAEAYVRVADFLTPGHGDVLYDLACAASLRGDLASAEDYLRKAWQAGMRLVDHIQADPDLRNLREDPRFARFMQEVVH